MSLTTRVDARAALILVAALVVAGCVGQGVSRPVSPLGTLNASTATPAAAHERLATPSLLPGALPYTDPQLGFRLDLLSGWSAQAYPGVSGVGASPAVSAVVLADTAAREDALQVSVFTSPAMPTAFARRGAPDTHVGPYPAFTLDTTLVGGRVPCLIRVFLARYDYVIASRSAP